MSSQGIKRLICFLLGKFFFFVLLLGPLCLETNARIISTEDLHSGSSHEHFVFDTVPINLEETTESADRIFTGVCTNIEVIKKDKRAKVPVVRYTFEITESIRGVDKKNKITFKQWEPTARDAGYQIGEKYVLFLHPNSILGLTSPVGLLQGQLNVEKDSNNQESVINRVSNTGLTRNLRTQKTLYVESDYNYLYNQIEKSSEHGEQIGYKEFIQFVKYLTNKKQ